MKELASPPWSVQAGEQDEKEENFVSICRDPNSLHVGAKAPREMIEVLWGYHVPSSDLLVKNLYSSILMYMEKQKNWWLS